MPATKNYRVTETARRYVAGHRVKADDVLSLTEEQARYALISGELELEAKPAREAASKAPKGALKDDKKAASAE